MLLRVTDKNLHKRKGSKLVIYRNKQSVGAIN